MSVSRREEPGEPVERLRAMVNGAHEALWVLAPSGRVLEVNRAASRLADPDGPRFATDLVAEVVATGLRVSAVATLASGITVLVSAAPAPASGPLRYVVVSARDVSETSRLMTRVQESARRSAEDRAELRRLDARLRHADRLVADSAAMRAACDLALRYAAVDSPVLLLGETGSGKGVLGRLIHEASARQAGPLLEVNCGAIPGALMEAELFGYARGAFTGADPRGKAGLVELAHGGTLILDEVGDLPLPLQVKLLRFLEGGEIWPVGALRGKRPDVRIVAATNRDLAAMLAANAFRRDLYYRLNVLTIEIPPLRERREDIPGLVDMMLRALGAKLARPVRLTPAALAALGRYPWPGNVRELWNLVERLAVTAREETIDVADLPREVREAAADPARRSGSALRQAVAALEATMLREALARFGTQDRAARHLGVGQATVARKVRRYGLTR
jgi:transcriptional regulator with PAS, ATPase and Fis domain